MGQQKEELVQANNEEKIHNIIILNNPFFPTSRRRKIFLSQQRGKIFPIPKRKKIIIIFLQKMSLFRMPMKKKLAQRGKAFQANSEENFS